VVLSDLLRGRESFGDLESRTPLPRETHVCMTSCCVVIPWEFCKSSASRSEESQPPQCGVGK